MSYSAVNIHDLQEPNSTSAKIPENPALMGNKSLANTTSSDAVAEDVSPSSNSLWDKAINSLSGSMDPQIFSAWIKPLSLVNFQNAEAGGVKEVQVVLGAPNKFCRSHVIKEYKTLLSDALLKETEADKVQLSVEVRAASKDAASNMTHVGSVDVLPEMVDKIVEEKKVARKRSAARRNSQLGNSNLNPQYNFSNFVVGGCNQFAHAASVRVSESPGSSYNPLFIYGGVGLGKTHLVNAIGNACRRRGKKVLIVSSEIFVNELIAALRSNRMQNFKEKFRSLDVLMIDDIQFLIGKERTQEEFFHTFNALHQKRSQIILTSDKTPQELTGLEERLRTRFASGLTADLQAPDFETRVAILIKKSESQNIPLENNVAQFLAEKIDTNVRELEGALNRLQAFSMLNKSPITLELAEGALRTIVPERTREITIELIQKTVSEHFGLEVKALLGKRRTQNIAFPRQVAMYLCRRLTSCSYPEIGTLFGGRDHSTVIHANRVIERKSSENESLAQELVAIERKLRGK